MIRFYILPIEIAEGNHRGPMYLKWRFNATGIDCKWSMKDYGLIPAAMVACDLTQAQHEQLVTNPDVAAAPENIDNNISDIAIPAVKEVLEALRIPAGWVTNAYTYRQILRMVGGLFLFAQRYHGMHNEQLIDNVGQLDLQWSQIPTDRQNRIKATADALGYTYADVKNTWLVRRILKHLADQWGNTPILFGFVTL